jgi:hypothetical protein
VSYSPLSYGSPAQVGQSAIVQGGPDIGIHRLPRAQLVDLRLDELPDVVRKNCRPSRVCPR